MAMGVSMVSWCAAGLSRSQTEGCVVDDERGRLYISEENVGVWKYSAEPDAGETRVLVDSVDGGQLVTDIPRANDLLWHGW